MKNNPTILSFLGEKITYDKIGQYIWAVDKEGGHQKLADLRGWGAIQNLFKNKDGSVNFDLAAQFQDELGNWIAEAITEKKNGSSHSNHLPENLEQTIADILVKNEVLRTPVLDEESNLIVHRDYFRKAVRNIVRSMKDAYKLGNQSQEISTASSPEESVRNFQKKETILDILDEYTDIFKWNKEQPEQLQRVPEMPDYWQIVEKEERGDKLTAVEAFLRDNEPADNDQSIAFREGLKSILMEAYGKK